MPTDEPKLSKVEAAKLRSDALRGTIAPVLADPAAGSFGEDDQVSLKFHGIYQQDDRDSRSQAAGKIYSLMIRVRIPGGALTAGQWLALDDLADRTGAGSLRLTTRQGIQYHGVAKGDLKAVMRSINDTLLSTLSACGDVNRNVMAPPAPFADEAHRSAQRLADEIARELSPATGAYHEIWLDGERVLESGDEEPFYGPQYLPRKFKVGVALDVDNSVDIFTYDCGLVAATEAGPQGRTTRGYNLVVGGGLGMTHNKPDTIARIATPIGFVRPEHAVEAVRTVAAIFRDHGDRSDRRHARLKYLLESWGVERFVEEFRCRVAWELAPAIAMPPPRELDHIGLHDQGDGRQFYGVFVENGRVIDRDGVRCRTALRAIVERFAPGVRVTPMQSVLLTDLELGSAVEIESILRDHGMRTVDELSTLRRWSMACPALPTCGLALADSERVMPSLIDTLEEEFRALGIDDVPLTVRMTGCPNGCARPYNADLAFVGRKPGIYHVYVGGGLGGDRLAELFAADVPFDAIVPTLRPLLDRYRRERQVNEPLGDFFQRALRDGDSVGERIRPRRILTGRELPTAPLIQLGIDIASPTAPAPVGEGEART